MVRNLRPAVLTEAGRGGGAQGCTYYQMLEGRTALATRRPTFIPGWLYHSAALDHEPVKMNPDYLPLDDISADYCAYEESTWQLH